MTERRFMHYPGGVQCIGGCGALIQYGWTVPNGPLCGRCRFGDPDDPHGPDDELAQIARDLTAERFSR